MSKNTAKKFGYARVSSTSQNLDRQIDSLQEYVSSERDIFCDKASGKNFEREEYQRLKGYLREGDELYVHSLDRLGRNKEQVLEELRYFSSAGIRVRILDLPTTMTEMPDGQSWILDMINNILVEVLATFAEQERLTIRKRQREGINAAHARGVKFGRPRKVPEGFEEYCKKVDEGYMTAADAWRQLGISKSQWYKLRKQV